MTDEATLIKKAQDGDIEAFSELVKLYQGSVRACLAVRMSSKFEADDLAQDTFVTAFRKIKEFDVTKPMGPWLRSIAFYNLRNYWRKHRAEPVGHGEELSLLVDEHVSLTYSERNESDTLDALRRCMTKLDDSMQDILPEVASRTWPVPVVDENNKYKGVVSKNRFLKTLHRSEETITQETTQETTIE